MWRQKTVIPVPLVGLVTAGQPILRRIQGDGSAVSYDLSIDTRGCFVSLLLRIDRFDDKC
ncbi:hypothetical protein [Sporomusa sp. KB1]|uniref:hypothetical protein n=1 Tax=Sporomusa sp. KB1 TaxID=943346 RepID=UPI001C95643C|nr:hypothetical protein [Sporomusa sp. KB1]